MKGICPSCGAGGSIELFIADVEWREAIIEAAKLPSDCGSLALRYIGMFRSGSRFLTPDRSARLIREMCAMIIDGVDFDRQHINAPSHVWRDAIIDMLDAPNVKRPLKNHNYLLRIVQSKLGQKSDIDQSERAATYRNQTKTDRQGAMKAVGEVLEKTALPDLPADQRDEWLEKAKIDLVENHDMKLGAFMSDFLIESRAKELYAGAQK